MLLGFVFISFTYFVAFIVNAKCTSMFSCLTVLLKHFTLDAFRSLILVQKY